MPGVQLEVKGRLAVDKVAAFLEELRTHSRTRAASVALLAAPADTDPEDLANLQEARGSPVFVIGSAFDLTASAAGRATAVSLDTCQSSR